MSTCNSRKLKKKQKTQINDLKFPPQEIRIKKQIKGNNKGQSGNQ